MKRGATNDLKKSWNSMVSGLNKYAVTDESNRWFQKLCTAYSGPNRHYHTLDHVEQILARQSTVNPGLRSHEDRTAFQLAAWFHDAVYDTHRTDNEEQSAALLAVAAAELSLPPHLVAVARDWIQATKSHDGSTTGSAAFCDADLAVLGSAPDVYDRYRRAIRAEYAWVGDDQYRDGRSRVLRSFLARDRIFRTDVMRDLFESTSRRNLSAELEQLTLKPRIPGV